LGLILHNGKGLKGTSQGRVKTESGRGERGWEKGRGGRRGEGGRETGRGGAGDGKRGMGDEETGRGRWERVAEVGGGRWCGTGKRERKMERREKIRKRNDEDTIKKSYNNINKEERWKTIVSRP
jgi:hypothetical protein